MPAARAHGSAARGDARAAGPGHEGVGVVAAVGAGVTAVERGEIEGRVVLRT
ncbi:hypothetical protein [Salinarimonas chemoclinalis]|uniref:hypothetical protein n=1 Tax=Salinarimonas chemoclinalis TaxID=3241599 RepID=UPI0035562E4F